MDLKPTIEDDDLDRAIVEAEQDAMATVGAVCLMLIIAGVTVAVAGRALLAIL